MNVLDLYQIVAQITTISAQFSFILSHSLFAIDILLFKFNDIVFSTLLSLISQISSISQPQAHNISVSKSE
jgi:hypothetical protein